MASKVSDSHWVQTIHRYGKKCWYCGRPAASIDHAVPLSRGGSNRPHNMVPACKICNSLKDDCTVGEFRKILRVFLCRRLLAVGQVPSKLPVVFFGEGNVSPFIISKAEVKLIRPRE